MSGKQENVSHESAQNEIQIIYAPCPTAATIGGVRGDGREQIQSLIHARRTTPTSLSNPNTDMWGGQTHFPRPPPAPKVAQVPKKLMSGGGGGESRGGGHPTLFLIGAPSGRTNSRASQNDVRGTNNPTFDVTFSPDNRAIQENRKMCHMSCAKWNTLYLPKFILPLQNDWGRVGHFILCPGTWFNTWGGHVPPPRICAHDSYIRILSHRHMFYG